MAMNRSAVGVFVLVVWGAEAAAQPPPTPVQAGAEFEAQLREALGNDRVGDAAVLIQKNPEAARRVIDGLDAHSPAAHTSFKVRERVAQEIMQEAIDRMNPADRAKLVSVEVAGTAAFKGPGFVPTTSDLDFQFRGADQGTSLKAREAALQVIRERGIPDWFKIHPHAAVPDSRAAPLNDAGLARNQMDLARLIQVQALDPEAAVGDAGDAVRRDNYDRGQAYEVRRDGRLAPRIPVDELYHKHGWPAPVVTPESAFGTIANEQAQFNTLAKDAKRVFRTADALASLPAGALTQAEKNTVALARAIYLEKGRDPAKAIGSLDEAHPVRVEYDKRCPRGCEASSAVVLDLLGRQDRAARAFIQRAAQQAFDVKVASIDAATTTSSGELLARQQALARAGSSNASDWLRRYDAMPAAQRAGTIKTLREDLAESRRQGLLAAFIRMVPNERDRLLRQPQHVNNAFLQNAAIHADVITGRDRLLAQGASRLRLELNLHAEGRAKAGPPGARAAGPSSPAPSRLDHADNVMTALALCGSLVKLRRDVSAAREQGGEAAARAAFARGVSQEARSQAFGLAYGYVVQRIAAVMAQAGGALASAAVRGTFTALTVQDIASTASGLMNLFVMDPLRADATRRFLDPTTGTSFWEFLNGRAARSPETLAPDLVTYARRHGLNPYNLEFALQHAVGEYLREWPDRSSAMVGVEQALLEALLPATIDSERRYQDLAASLGAGAIRPAGTPVPTPATAGTPSPADDADDFDKAKAEADAAARRARLGKSARTPALKEDDKDPQLPPTKRWQDLARQAAVEKARAAEALQRQQQRERAEQEARWRAEADALRRQEEEDAKLQAAMAALGSVRIELKSVATINPGGMMGIAVKVVAPPGVTIGDVVEATASRGQLDKATWSLSRSGETTLVFTAPMEPGPVRFTVRLPDAGVSAAGRITDVVAQKSVMVELLEETPPPSPPAEEPPKEVPPPPNPEPPKDKPAPPPPKPGPPCPPAPLPGLENLQTNLRCFGIPGPGQ